MGHRLERAANMIIIKFLTITNIHILTSLTYNSADLQAFYLANIIYIILVNAEHYGRAGANPKEYGNDIHCHVCTFAKFHENTTILSYIHVQ